jgi:hypothetical protein
MQKRLRIPGIAAFVAATLVSTTLAIASDSSDNLASRYSEVTPDGLHRVDDPVLGIAWMKPGVDFKQYTKVWITPAGMTFKGRTDKHHNEYALDEHQQDAFRKTMVKVFNEELAKSTRYTLTDAPGDGVLQVRGAILDVVSHSPPEPMGRGAVLTKELGEATLVVELVDSRTGEVLARGADRRIATSPWVRKSNKTNNLFELRSAARQWAGELRRRLDDL